MPTTVRELMTETIKTAFQPDKAKGVDTIVKDQKCESTEGLHPDPKMTMTVDSEDYIKISTGELDATMAFMKGKVKVSGDMGVALGMGKYFVFGK